MRNGPIKTAPGPATSFYTRREILSSGLLARGKRRVKMGRKGGSRSSLDVQSPRILRIPSVGGIACYRKQRRRICCDTKNN